MKAAPLPPNEEERLRLLRHLETMDANPEELFGAVTRALMLICEVPIARVSLSDEAYQWFKLETENRPIEAPAAAVLCKLAYQQNEMLVIPDVANDQRTRDELLLQDNPKIRFFAGNPLKLSPKIRMGTLYAIDYLPRKLDDKQIELFRLLASQVTALIRLRLDRVEASREFSTLVMVKQKLQFQKDLMEAILDNEPESVQILSTDGRLEQINKAGLDMLETGSLTEARQRKLADYVLPEYRERFSELEQKAFRGEHSIAEYRIRGAKGTERWMESHVAPLRDQQGKISELIAITRDVTEIKQSQQGLVLAARVFSEAQEGIIITDANSIIVDVNPAFCAVTGYSREEVIGQTPRILRSGLQGPEFYEALWRTLGATGHWKGEIWNRKKNGELYAELISINALRDQAGNAINYVALFLDITDIKKQQGEIPDSPKPG